jgi:hypothetical protein
MSVATPSSSTPARHRPKSFTVFAAAFLAGAAAAVGVNRVLDVQLAQRKPQVECEPIFVSLRSLPQGAPITVWDVALKDWPKAMLPASALRASDSFEGFVLKHALREGQPLLAVQLVRAESGAATSPAVTDESFVAPVPASTSSTDTDLWTPTGSPTAPKTTVATLPAEPNEAAPAAQPERDGERMDGGATTAAAEPSPPPAATSVADTPAPARPTQAEPVGEPTPAIADRMAAQRVELPPIGPTVATSPSDIEPLVSEPLLRQRSTEVAAENDLADAVPPDVASMPSVMAPSKESAASTVRPDSKQSGRYLVVPERVAIQADTSFTTPRPEPPGPPTAGDATVPTPTRSPAGVSPQRQQSPASSVGRATQRREQQPASRGQQGRAQQQSQPRGRQPAQPSQQPQQPQQQRTWGGFFPNMAAGIDAMGGSWQKARSGSTQQPPAAGQPAARR